MITMATARVPSSVRKRTHLAFFLTATLPHGGPNKQALTDSRDHFALVLLSQNLARVICRVVDHWGALTGMITLIEEGYY